MAESFLFRVNGIIVVLFRLMFSPTDKHHCSVILRSLCSNSQRVTSNFLSDYYDYVLCIAYIFEAPLVFVAGNPLLGSIG